MISMRSWREDYLVAIENAEQESLVDMELVQTCSLMADKISALEAENAALNARLAGTKMTAPKASKGIDAPGTSADDSTHTQLRLDLAESFRSKASVEARLRVTEEEAEKLRKATKGDAEALRSIEAERQILLRRSKDREHELREKRKLLEVSMVERERDKLRKENKDLVDRWMKRMGEEADAMNLANRPTNGNRP